ncbi:LemA family protein [Ancrocorticia populi]|uniref:LemA family protein n=1 Tax=Ancrocorticia populi TaxID=2175228 RepID=UPI0027087B53|nr:LemA family protein [Ancrocorticia sp.]
MPVAAIVAIVVVLAVLAGWIALTYRSFVTLRNLVQEGRRRIDLELNARYGLISSFVEVVATHAKDTEALEAVIEARTLATEPGTSMTVRGQREDHLTQAISRVIVLSEQNAALWADQSFGSIRGELEAIRTRITEASRFYNANARDLNAKRESFPSNIVASVFHFGHAEYFQADPTRMVLASDQGDAE